MTLRHLRIFLAVKENHCNTTRAAEALHMTQPAVSLAIRELEEYYGVVLFDRVGRRLRLTAAGKRFGEYAGCILAMFDDMEKGMRNWDAFGLLRVGSSITIGSQFLPYYVNAFYARHPGTEVKVLVGPSDQLEQKLLAGELDLALIEGTVHSAGLVAQPYMEDSLSVICPAGGIGKTGTRNRGVPFPGKPSGELSPSYPLSPAGAMVRQPPAVSSTISPGPSSWASW